MFTGIWTALWTPVDKQGKLMKGALKNHLAFLKKSGVKGIVAGGSTGEFPRLGLALRKELLESVLHETDLPVLVNISDVIPDNVKKLASHAKKVGACGVMVLPPSYFPVSQDDIIAYFIQVSKWSKDLPFILYNFPACVRNPLESGTVATIADEIPVAGIKQSGDFDFHKALVAVGNEKGFSVLTGADKRLIEAVQLGVKGSIGGLSNAIPELILDVFKNGNKKSQAKIEAIAEVISKALFPYDVAALMEARGLEIGAPKIVRSANGLKMHSQIVKELAQIL